jgi:hypothetical protein
MKPEGRRIPDVLLHRYLASVLEGEARARVEQLLADSEVDRARLEELRAEASAFLVSHPPGPLVAHVERRVGERRRRRWWWWGGALAVPVLAGLAALSLLLARPEEPSRDERAWAVMGNRVALRVLRQSGAGGERVASEDVLAPGDILQFEIRSGTSGFLAVVGRDATGRVRVYYPEDAREAVLIPKGRTELRPFPLGEAPGNEEVHAFFSSAPFELAPVVRALEEGRPVADAVPPGARVTSRTLRKQQEP